MGSRNSEKRSLRAIRLGVVLVVGIALATPASAGAKKQPLKVKVGVQSAPFLGATGQTGSVTATCPGKTKAISGGWSAPVNLFASDSSAPFIYESRIASSKSWQVSAYEARLGSPSVPSQLTAFVYCLRGKGTTKTGTASFSYSDTPGSATAACPAGTKAISGGFSVPPPNTVLTPFPFQSYRSSPTTWQAGAVNAGGGVATGSVFVYCRKGKPGSSASGAFTLTSLAHTNSTSPACVGRKRASAGGFDETPPDGGSHVAVLTESYRVQTRIWKTTAVEIVGASPSNVTGFVYCR